MATAIILTPFPRGREITPANRAKVERLIMEVGATLDIPAEWPENRALINAMWRPDIPIEQRRPCVTLEDMQRLAKVTGGQLIQANVGDFGDAPSEWIRPN